MIGDPYYIEEEDMSMSYGDGVVLKIEVKYGTETHVFSLPVHSEEADASLSVCVSKVPATALLELVEQPLSNSRSSLLTSIDAESSSIVPLFSPLPTAPPRTLNYPPLSALENASDDGDEVGSTSTCRPLIRRGDFDGASMSSGEGSCRCGLEDETNHGRPAAHFSSDDDEDVVAEQRRSSILFEVLEEEMEEELLEEHETGNVIYSESDSEASDYGMGRAVFPNDIALLRPRPQSDNGIWGGHDVWVEAEKRPASFAGFETMREAQAQTLRWVTQVNTARNFDFEDVFRRGQGRGAATDIPALAEMGTQTIGLAMANAETQVSSHGVDSAVQAGISFQVTTSGTQTSTTSSPTLSVDTCTSTDASTSTQTISPSFTTRGTHPLPTRVSASTSTQASLSTKDSSTSTELPFLVLNEPHTRSLSPPPSPTSRFTAYEKRGHLLWAGLAAISEDEEPEQHEEAENQAEEDRDEEGEEDYVIVAV
ncbi:hypothetical protein HK104_004928 [Borealophlyctis nickersoniae]|nr:hypothetical protein HK104_004928 [Borealophlyctis nickersoniae]